MGKAFNQRVGKIEDEDFLHEAVLSFSSVPCQLTIRVERPRDQRLDDPPTPAAVRSNAWLDCPPTESRATDDVSVELGRRSPPGVAPSGGSGHVHPRRSAPPWAGVGGGVERSGAPWRPCAPLPVTPVHDGFASARPRPFALSCRSLRPPAPTPSRRAGGRQPGGGWRCTPAAAPRRDSPRQARHPRPRVLRHGPRGPHPARGLMAAGSGPTLRLGSGRTGPNTAPAPPWPAVQARARAPGRARAAGASSAGATGPRWVWPALPTERPPAGPHTRPTAGWRAGLRAGSGPGRPTPRARAPSAPGCAHATSRGPACAAESPCAAGAGPPAARACHTPPPGGGRPAVCPETPP